MIQLFASMLLFSSVSVQAQEPLGFTICKNSKIVRSIRVEKDPATGEFITLYAKSGKDKEVGRARWRPSAEKFQTNIKSNLEKAGWECTNVASYEVVRSKE